MTPLRVALAIAAGLALSLLPFARYLHPGHGVLPHQDHAPRHGGELVMVGDHHLELVRRRGALELFVSGPRREPLLARSGEVIFDDAETRLLVADGGRLRAPDRPGALTRHVRVVLQDGTQVDWRFR